MRIEYLEIAANDLDIVAPLWDKLRKHQEILSPNFSEHYARRPWKARRAGLLETAGHDSLHTDLAKDKDTGQAAGYCISTVSPDKKGCLESIYVEPDYRGNDIGDTMMVKAIEWMKSQKAQSIILNVGVGNEAVISFYKRYGFYPRTIVLQKKD
jgi:diamine N-acetyltransferase